MNKFGENKNVQILGYTNKMDDLMKMATVMVTKPGGITLSEALAVQVPLIYIALFPVKNGKMLYFLNKMGLLLTLATLTNSSMQ
ncbi:hypothetical protein CV093_15440 [Oceanobacillus sp. 143]|nr:hypothetical protein CV093_15440 [Oceanobacillus sp. 143]